MTLPTVSEVAASVDVIYECAMNGTRVVGVRDYVVKYGPHISNSEADSLVFVQANTRLPVPRVFATFSHDNKNYIVMSRLPGQQLSRVLLTLSTDEIDTIATELKSMMEDMRRLRVADFETESFIGSIGRRPCTDMIFRLGIESKGPFKAIDEMHDNILERYANLVTRSEIWTLHHRRLYREATGTQSIVFTHGDLSPQNILVEGGHVSGIVDWEQAGWYPEYWEYVKAMWGSIGTWETSWPLSIPKWLKPYDYLTLIDQPIRREFR
jgi:aminoglycoside phosphotransferase